MVCREPRASLPVPESCRIAVRATPNASRGAIIGWAGEVLKVKVRAPALDGRANEALCELLAARLGLPKNAVALCRGAKSRSKVVDIRGLGSMEVRAKLALPP
jgi:uncharacterized protein (TIGR00251 family)